VSTPDTGLQLRSLVKASAELEISLAPVPVSEPAADEVVVRVEASPINPSDLGLLFGLADMTTAKTSGTPTSPVITARIPAESMQALAGRLNQSLPVGNEGAGVVVKTGSSEPARALQGRTVAVLDGAMYSQYRTLKVAQCLPLPAGTTPAEGASCFVNPLTALGMVETMRREGHSALVHTAAASNLGRMLNRICLQDGVPLVHIVRRKEQADLLRAQGAKQVCDSSSPAFLQSLTQAVQETGATLAFDAVGGGRLASQILTCMEAAAVARMSEYSRYGSSTHKQIYIYGVLDRGPTVLERDFGMMWSVSGWLLTPFLQKIGPAAVQKLRERIVAELKTTFASSYARQISLRGALQLDVIRQYGKIGTGEKFLIDPSKD
jgi:NADPH:quinone reductase-like Zn-dependent oxidoreductase